MQGDSTARARFPWLRSFALVGGVVAVWAGLMLAFGVSAQGPALFMAQGAGLVSKEAPAERSAGASNVLPGPAELSRTFAAVVKKVEPAVVNISTSQTARRRVRSDTPFDDFFDRFFGGPGGGGRDQPESRRRQSLGSGVIVDPKGHVLTNHHVIAEADEITVTVSDGTEYTAKVLGTDSETDLAVIQIRGERFPTAPLGDSDRMEVGDWVLAVGNPFGLGGTVTAGIISAKGRDIRQGTYDDFLQTDAAINPGNSGGPLINMNGEVVGINSNILSSNGGNMGIGFAIPAKMVRKIYDQLVEKGTVTRGWLGVNIQNLTPDLARNFGLEGKKGALVSGIVGEDSPAEKAGLRKGDVIVELNGQTIDSNHGLVQLVADVPPGATAELKYYRDGKLQTAKVKLGTRDVGKVAEDQSAPEQGDRGRLGITARDLTPQMASQMGARSKTGVVIVELEADGTAAEAGLTRGDIIKEANRQEIRSVEELQRVLAKVPSGGDLLIHVERAGGGQSATLFVSVKLN